MHRGRGRLAKECIALSTAVQFELLALRHKVFCRDGERLNFDFLNSTGADLRHFTS